jgi:hypothetical protein
MTEFKLRTRWTIYAKRKNERRSRILRFPQGILVRMRTDSGLVRSDIECSIELLHGLTKSAILGATCQFSSS